ncbi:hypothetical protein CP8484711_1747, partial [Chlamydia psittaci 84-8471/1]
EENIESTTSPAAVFKTLQDVEAEDEAEASSFRVTLVDGTAEGRGVFILIFARVIYGDIEAMKII